MKKRIDGIQLMSVPAALMYGTFFIFPLIQGIRLSFTDWDGMTKASFVGFSNYTKFFSDTRALGDIKTTVLFALGSALLLNLVGLGYALLMKKKFRLQSIVRVIIYLPAIISPLIMGYIWYFLLQPGRGFLYRAVEYFGNTMSWNWMANYSNTIVILILVNVWQYAGMTMIIYLAGLQSIPKELYESASMDGASRMQVFNKVTIPLLVPSIRINIVTNIIGSLSVFDVIMSLTEGGPGYSTESLSIYIMRMCYGNKTGYSTAVAMILFLLILVPVLISFRLTKSRS
jgi:raffinose/stachyose/melibiose transport system permease protein